MNYYPTDGLQPQLQEWMRARFLNPILNIEGGWEYWIQIDYPAWLDVECSRQYDFRREQQLSHPGGRIDWLINSLQEPANDVTGVELKAQTHKYLSGRFKADVRDDVTKLEQWKAYGHMQHGIAIAATIDQTVARDLTREDEFVQWFVFEKEVTFLAKII